MADIKVIVREFEGSEWVPANAMQQLIDQNNRQASFLAEATRLIRDIASEPGPKA